MSLSKELTSKGTLRLEFYLSEAPPPYVTILHTPLTHLYTCMQYTYSHREGGGKLTRDKVRGAIVHKACRKYQHD
jgi:hypothetical protein